MSFGKMLKRLREQKGLTQKELSEGFIHISRDTYAQYEIDRRQPDFKTLQKLADFFNVSTDYLLCRTDDPTPPGAPRDPDKPLSPETRRLLSAAGHLTPRQTEMITEVVEEWADAERIRAAAQADAEAKAEEKARAAARAEAQEESPGDYLQIAAHKEGHGDVDVDGLLEHIEERARIVEEREKKER